MYHAFAKSTASRSRTDGLITSITAIVLTALVVSMIYYQHTLAIITVSGERAGLTITHTFLNSIDTQLLDFIKQAATVDSHPKESLSPDVAIQRAGPS